MNFNRNLFREIIGILFLFIVMFSTISLLSYDPFDPSIIQNIQVNNNTKNLFGILGSNFAGILIITFGLGSFWTPVLIAIITNNFFLKKISTITILEIITGGILLIVTTGAILSFKQPYYFILNKQFPAGGIVGGALKNSLVAYSNQTGGISILILTWVIGFTITTGLSLVSIYTTLKSSMLIIVKNIVVFTYNIIISLYNYRNITLKKIISSPKITTPITSTEKNSKIPKNTLIKTQTKYNTPPIDLLENPENKTHSKSSINYATQSKLLNSKLEDFGVNGNVVAVNPGPVVTTFEYKPAPGVKINKIVNLTDDLALALSAKNIRVLAPIPGKSVVGIEIPNDNREIVKFKEVITSENFITDNSILTLCLGKNIIGSTISAGLEKMPHLLIAGATGTGKSVMLNTMICSLLYKLTPKQIQLILIDPKRIELSIYDGIPHLITPVITNIKKATNALSWAIREMENRYKLLSEIKVKNISQYNTKIQKSNSKNKQIPYIIIVIDELADLMMISSHNNVEIALTRLAQMARAAGIHLILATQRPSVDVLTGIIKANFPTRLTFQVSSKTDSRTIIDANGAENLLGNGDMLFMPPGTSKLERIHGAYISEKECTYITEFLRKQQKPKYDETVIENKIEIKHNSENKQEYDTHYDTAVELVTRTKQASTSMIQRQLRIGYNRAARIVETMEKEGIIGPQIGSKAREVLVKSYDES